MTSELRVDRIVPTTGVPTGGGGGIIQVVQVTKTDQFATSSTSYTDVQGCQPALHQLGMIVRSLLGYV